MTEQRPYTLEDQRRVEEGLHILARIIVRVRLEELRGSAGTSGVEAAEAQATKVGKGASKRPSRRRVK